MAMLKLNKLPRFYVACNQKCEQIINPTNLGNLINKEVCQRTERTAEYCHIAKFLLYGIKIIIYVVNLINSQPKILQETFVNNRTITGTSDSFQDTKIVNNSKAKKVDNKYIYIQVEKPKTKRNLRIRRITAGNRKSPRAHTRRGHYRHLKSGKVIWIEMSYVGLKEKANEKKKIYKIK